ncbi:MAG: cation:proton antiporter [Planctomycetota bacterium]|nr:cation:proton antiporter [Planctomycetota bacterium]MDA1261525.1 cation:proton antiporter [Planctomycetota bacterium]
MKLRTTTIQNRKDRPRFGATFLAVSLICLVGLILVTRELRMSITGIPQSNLPAAGETTLLLGVIILGSWLSGRLIRRIGLPPITGQLLFGVLVGPSFWSWLNRPELSLINASQLVSLQGPESLAVIMIGLVAGAEIDWPFLRDRLRVITALAAGQMGFVCIAVGLVAFAFLNSIPQAIIVATIAATSSSAVSVALLREMRHPTEFARLLLATTVAKDLFLVVAFSIVLFVIAATSSSTHIHQAWYWIMLHLAGSIGVGIALAFPLRWALARIERRMTAVVIVTAIFLAIFCSTIGIAPLITALTLGYTARNIAPIVTSSFFATARRLFLAVCCVFFAAAGAHLDLSALVANWGVVFAISAVRFAGIWTGATIAAGTNGLSPTATRWAWAGFIPQAGISLALAAQIAVEFPNEKWASSLATIVIACITLNEMIGPILMRIALRKVPSHE